MAVLILISLRRVLHALSFKLIFIELKSINTLGLRGSQKRLSLVEVSMRLAHLRMQRRLRLGVHWLRQVTQQKERDLAEKR